MMRVIGVARTALKTAAGNSGKGVWRKPSATVCRETSRSSPVAGPGKAGEEDGRHGDGEHSLREHVDPEGGIDRARGELRIDETRSEERVDDEVEVDEAETDRHGHHQHEDAPHG